MKITKITESQMLQVSGGVSVEEYCQIAKTLIGNNFEEWSPEVQKSALKGYQQFCLN